MGQTQESQFTLRRMFVVTGLVGVLFALYRFVGFGPWLVCSSTTARGCPIWARF